MAQLTEAQVEQLWQNKMAAEARANYFAEIASIESIRKRWITGGSFILGSATVVTILSKCPPWSSVLCSALIAIANGYQIAIGQDGKIRTAGKLHLGWLKLEHNYERLWSHTGDNDAESILQECLDCERELSETAATEIGHKQKRWLYWLDKVHKKYEAADYDCKIQSTNSAAPTESKQEK